MGFLFVAMIFQLRSLPFNFYNEMSFADFSTKVYGVATESETKIHNVFQTLEGGGGGGGVYFAYVVIRDVP